MNMDNDRMNQMAAKVRDDVLWLAAKYRELDSEHVELRRGVMNVADALERNKDNPALVGQISLSLREMLWT